MGLVRLLWPIVRRVAGAAAVLLGISVVVFLIFFATPGADPAARLAGRGAAPEILAQVRMEYGLDRSLPVQYASLMRRLFVTRDLPSFVNRGQLVVPAILGAAPVTIALVAGAAVLWVSGGLGIALLAVWSGWGRLVVSFGLLGVSVPAFWLGQMVVLATQGAWNGGAWSGGAGSGGGAVPWQAALFGWVPALGVEPASASEWVRSMILPCVTLAVLYAGIYGRILRTGLAGELARDYARTARAKGLGEARVALRHALPNAAVPAVALLGLDVGALLGGGTVLIEAVFGLHGIGRLTYDALLSLDLAMVMGCVLYGAALVTLSSMLVDMVQVVLDPRLMR